MPYEVRSHCQAGQAGDDFVIGLWPEHLGVFVYCRKVVNVSLDGEACPGCGCPPPVEEFDDYAGSIPYLGGQSMGPLEPGPECPKCRRDRLAFETTAHFNVGPLGTPKAGRTPWVGRDYLEKAIFVYSLMAVCMEFELDPDEVLRYYHLDVPRGLIAGRRFSLPILLDIRTHLLTIAALGGASFAVSPKLRSAVAEQFGALTDVLEPGKRWWQIWKS